MIIIIIALWPVERRLLQAFPLSLLSKRRATHATAVSSHCSSAVWRGSHSLFPIANSFFPVPFLRVPPSLLLPSTRCLLEVSR